MAWRRSSTGKVRVSARMRGTDLKIRLRCWFTVTAGAVITVRTELDLAGKPILRIIS